MEKRGVKKQFLIGFFILVVSSLVVLGGQQPGLGNGPETAGELFYYSDGEKIPLTMSTDYIAVRFAAGGEFHPSARFPATITAAEGRNLSKNRLTLYRLKAGATKADVKGLQNALSADPSIELVPLVCTAPGATMIVTDEFIAKFAPEISEDKINAFNAAHGVEVVKKMQGLENTYILRVTSGNALEAANTYHEADGVTFAHPNFVRIMKHTPLQLHNRNQRVVIGPNGQALSPDTPIPKGSTGYRAVEPASFTLSSGFGPMIPVSDTTIKTETFEGTFPNTWTLYGTPTWDDESYRPYAGSWSGYCVGSTVAPPGPYPNSADARMTYGSFSLANALDARVDLQAWIETEADYDYFCSYASIDGGNFYGSCFSGDWAGYHGGNGWMNIMFDLKDVYTLGNICGQPNVWIMGRFYSDTSDTYEGVYLDNVVVEKITGGYENLTTDDYEHLQWSLMNNGQLWGTPGADIRAPAAWMISYGSGITIAIIDEGVDLTHPDLAGHLVTGYDATGGGTSGGYEPGSDDAHGTNCAGIAAASANNSQGVAGIARSASIVPVRIAYGDGFGGWTTTDAWIADGITWAYTHGADVLSNSWGGGSPAAVITTAISNAKSSGRGGKGSVVCFSSGNDNSAVSYPATLTTVLAVGALSPCDERKAPTSCDGEYWWGSNYGAELDICAPGVHMYSTDIVGANGYDTGSYYYDFNGTSSACPVVAGVAALILSNNTGLTATEVENVIKDTATDLGAAGWDQYTGYGRVNAYRAVGATAGIGPTACDYDQDGQTDIGVYRPSTGAWYLRRSTVGTQTATWGGNVNDVPVPEDFDGDGATDITVYRSNTGWWYVKDVGNYLYGGTGYIPIPADYDGDRDIDLGVYRSSSGWWYVKGVGNYLFGGLADDIPVPGDYDGDGTTDVAIYRSSTGWWYVKGVGMFLYGGAAGDIPVPGDYNGDGTTDIALYRPSSGGWYIRGVGNYTYGGAAGDIPVPGDYDRDGTTEIAIFRPSNGTWYIRGASTFSIWGQSGDTPLTRNIWIWQETGLVP